MCLCAYVVCECVGLRERVMILPTILHEETAFKDPVVTIYPKGVIPDIIVINILILRLFEAVLMYLLPLGDSATSSKHNAYTLLIESKTE